MEIIRGRMKVTDTDDKIVETEHGISCGCGNAILSLNTHIDGVDFYESIYSCQCGNSISVRVKREKEIENDRI
jgi:hypothetical protein